MPFPLAVGDSVCTAPPQLAALLAEAARDARAPRPSHTVGELVADGRLSAGEATALTVAFLQQPDPALVCEGARMAVLLGDPRLGPVVLDVLDALDPAVLLATDPLDPQHSTEDVLLGAAARIVDCRDDARRERLLRRLRHAGLGSLEVAVLCAFGTVPELRRWMPAIFAEGLRVDDIPAIAARMARGDAGADAIREALDVLEPEARSVVLTTLGEGRPPAEA